MENVKYFKEIVDSFENEDLKELCGVLMVTIPTYFWTAPASSTGKYHPSYALGDGGLVRHTVALCKIMNSIFEVTPYFNSRERDCLRIAGIMHDTRKSGNQKDYEKNKFTNFDHPLQAAKVVRNCKGQKWNDSEIELIANAIESHMGQWNKDTRSDTILPLPENKYQYLLHVCDYLASRKFLECKFDGMEQDLVMPFGKYSGQKLSAIPKDYLTWLYNNSDNLREPLKSSIEKIIAE